ncbi:MAG: YhjD/YihY/BrkB family envelope integrity protein [Micavibrio sp.]|nr:YhjD/YihY/BrkB family envelope integrity protein [Micavibrio sp.]
MDLNLNKVSQNFFEKVFEGGLHPKSRAGLLSIRLLRLVVAVTRDMQEGNYAQRAASLAYTTLLSFAPLLAIAFSVMKGFGARDQLRPFLKSFLEPLGAQSAELADKISGFVENISVGVLGAVGVALLLYGTISMMQKIEEAFNDIWRVPNTRAFMKRMQDYLGVLLIGPLFLFLSVAMTAAVRHANVVYQWLHIDLVDSAMEQVFNVVPYFLFMLAFAALYMVMPNTRVRWVPALLAGFLTGIIWKVLGIMFGIFVTGSASYAAIYSAFAAIVLFMIWIYAGWMTLLAGAAICYYIQNPSNQALSRRVRSLSLRVKEKLALQICAEIGQAFYKQGHGMTLQQLALRLGIPALSVDDVVEDLVTQGILVLTGEDNPHYIPAVPFDTTSAAAVLEKIRAADEIAMLQLVRIKAFPAVDAAVENANKALEKALGTTTLKQLSLGSVE